MEVGDEVELEVGKLVVGGDGLAFAAGLAVFVPFALPGERLRARVRSLGRGFVRAWPVELLSASPDRVAPRCPHFGSCGGCSLQHFRHDGQLAEKARIVRELWAREAGIELREVETVSGEAWGYRNRMRFHSDAGGRPSLNRMESSELVAIEACPVADPAIQGWLPEGFGEVGPGQVGAAGGRAATSGAARAEGRVVFGSEGKVWVEGRHPKAKVTVKGERFEFPVGGFFQSNLGLLGELVAAAVEGCAGGLAADLYAGAGLFGRFLSLAGARVVMVEAERGSLEAARANAPGPANEWHAERVESWCRGAGARLRPDFVLVDPPRAGLSPTVRAWLAAAKPTRLSYVSCDPATLARDARDLVAAGFRLESLRLFDFYPQTGHIESLARFVRDGAA